MTKVKWYYPDSLIMTLHERDSYVRVRNAASEMHEALIDATNVLRAIKEGETVDVSGVLDMCESALVLAAKGPYQ